MRIIPFVLFSFLCTYSVAGFACDKSEILDSAKRAVAASISKCSGLQWNRDSLKFRCEDHGDYFMCSASYVTMKGTPVHLETMLTEKREFGVAPIVNERYDDEGNPLPPEVICKARIASALYSVNSNSGQQLGDACFPRDGMR